jgi:hypothetical protein
LALLFAAEKTSRMPAGIAIEDAGYTGNALDDSADVDPCAAVWSAAVASV